MKVTGQQKPLNNWRKVEREADALLQAAGLASLDHEGAEFGRLSRRLRGVSLLTGNVEACSSITNLAQKVFRVYNYPPLMQQFAAIADNVAIRRYRR